MSRSSLSVKFSISDLVERLNDDECIEVIRLLQHEIGHKALKSIVNIIIQCALSLSNKSLINIENTIKDKYCARFTNRAVSASKRNNDTTVPSNVLFSLHELPNDLILTTSLFLNEKDIFQFEQCCRLFYKMINHTSYLSQCNNFKHFVITKNRLNQMKDWTYSFFKYSKANQLTFNQRLQLNDDETKNYKSSSVAAFNDFEATMNRMKSMGRYDHWWTSLCKSISILDIARYTPIGVYLSQIPIDILFNPHPNQSHLKTIKLPMSHCCSINCKKTCDNYMNKFEEKFLQCKKKWEQQGLQIKSLKCIKHRQCVSGLLVKPRYIAAKYVWMSTVTVDLTDDKFLTNKCNPGMKILTIQNGINLITSTKNDRKSINGNGSCILINRGLEIETLRLLTQAEWTRLNICNAEIAIESLNLQYSLKNLTIELIINSVCTRKTTLQNVLQKKYYHNLENVNMILDFPTKNTNIDWFFKLLKDNCKILKYQFKKLNIVIFKHVVNDGYHQQLYFVLEWNENLDDKGLDQLKKQFDEMKGDDSNQQQFEEKYWFMRKQWSH